MAAIVDCMKINGQQEKGPREVQIPVPWGHICGKWWGPANVQPILALHGWQDNAGTYDTLAPLISADTAVLCIDLPGHGLSSHLPTGEFYYIFWDGVVYVRRIVKYFNWEKVKLLGHSLGGAISFLYAASYPDEVEFVISLDIVSPTVRKISAIVDATGVNVDRFLKFENLSEENMPCYEYDEMVSIVKDAYSGGLTRESAEIMMKRGMQPASTPGRYFFSRDVRLKVSLLGMMTLELSMAYAQKITCPYLNIRAMPGLKLDNPENYDTVLNEIKSRSSRFEYHKIEGTHHVHLNEPEKLAPIINNFINSK